MNSGASKEGVPPPKKTVSIGLPAAKGARASNSLRTTSVQRRCCTAGNSQLAKSQ
jgi:hypothetical protein